MPSPAGIAVDPYVANWNAQHPNQPIEAYSTPTGAKGYRYLGSASGVNPSGATSPNAKPGSGTPVTPGSNTSPAPAGSGNGIATPPDTLDTPPIVTQPDTGGDNQGSGSGPGASTGTGKSADKGPLAGMTTSVDQGFSSHSVNNAAGTIAGTGLSLAGAPGIAAGAIGAGITTGLDTIDANRENAKLAQNQNISPDQLGNLSVGDIAESFAANTSLGAAYNAMSSFVNDHFGLNLGQIENVAANQAQNAALANSLAQDQASWAADQQASKDLNAPGGPVDQANNAANQAAAGQGNVSPDNVSNAYGGAPSNDGRANISPDDVGDNSNTGVGDNSNTGGYGSSTDATGGDARGDRDNFGSGVGGNDGGNEGGGSGHEGHESDGGADGSGSDGGSSGNAATGGYIRGPGTGTSDSINAHLSNQEYVSDAHTVKTFGPEFFGALQVLAHKGNPPVNNTTQHFATGGMASIQGFNLPQASMAHVSHVAPPKIQIKTHGTVGTTPRFAGGGMMVAPETAPIVDPAQQRMDQASQIVQQGLAQFANGGETHYYADGGMVGAPMAPQGPASAPAPVPAQQPIMAPPGQPQPGPGPSPNPDQAQQPKGPPPFVFPPEIAQYIGYEKLEKMVQSTAEKLAKNAAAHQQAQQQSNSAPQGGMASPPPQAQNGPLPGNLNPAPVNPMQNPTGVGASPAQMPNRQPAASLTGPVSKSFMGV